VKPHSGGAWKASNKWGKVKYFGKDFKKSAEKHAGISENLIDEVAHNWATKKTDDGYEWNVHRVEYGKPMTILHKGTARSRASAANQAKKHVMKYRRLTTEEVEQIDELSKKTLGSYIKKANKDSVSRGIEYGFSRDKKDSLSALEKLPNRTKGIKRATDKLTKEEVEQIDELSPERLAKYKKQAEKQSGSLMKTMRKHFNKADRVGIGGAANTEKSQKHTELGRAAYSKALKRTAGAAMASSKLTKEELAMIEAKMAGVADGALPGDEHMCATKVFHKEWAEGTPIKTMHADPDENGLIEWYDVMFDHGIERVMTEDMEIISEMSHGHKKRKMKEEVELDEARGRPKKAGQMDYTVHPNTKEKLMHNNPAHMKRIENLYRIGTLERPKKEAGQNVITQLRKASTSMRGGETINFTHGAAKHVSGTHAAKLLDKHASMKPAEKEAFQKEIGHSHEKLKKHL
jgi:hypothetical protein